MHKFKLIFTVVMELKFSLPSPNMTISNVLLVCVHVVYCITASHNGRQYQIQVSVSEILHDFH